MCIRDRANVAVHSKVISIRRKRIAASNHARGETARRGGNVFCSSEVQLVVRRQLISVSDFSPAMEPAALRPTRQKVAMSCDVLREHFRFSTIPVKPLLTSRYTYSGHLRQFLRMRFAREHVCQGIRRRLLVQREVSCDRKQGKWHESFFRQITISYLGMSLALGCWDLQPDLGNTGNCVAPLPVRPYWCRAG